jgi:hypothetical protein
LEKEAKTFAYMAYALPQRARHISKSFLVLFFKKELLAFLPDESHSMPTGKRTDGAALLLLGVLRVLLGELDESEKSPLVTMCHGAPGRLRR